jgi:ABC-type nitrate/sulfonate/bicarbonate transport system ATPase subunit
VVAAVQDVSFEVYDKEFVAIVGPSGCGKSTILNMIGALVTPTAGGITIDGAPVTGPEFPPNVGDVFQKALLDRPVLHQPAVADRAALRVPRIRQGAPQHLADGQLDD